MMRDTPKKSSYVSPVVVSVTLERDLYPEEITVIHTINQVFSPADIRLVYGDRILSAELYKLDPEKFSRESHLLVVSSGLYERYKNGGDNPFAILMGKILAIGSYGIRYRKRVYAGYADERKVSGRKDKEAERGSYFYARDNSFTQERNILSEGDINRIMCGDSETLLASLPDNCIDIIITSPPYNFGLTYSSSGDSAHWEAYLDKLYRIFSEGIRVLCYGGRFIVNVQPLFSDYIPLHHLISSFFMGQKMIWKGEILWEKNNYNCKYTSWGSWKSPSSPYLKYTWEFIEIFCKGSLKKGGETRDIDITDEEFKEWVVAKWSIGPERRMKQFNHPAMFPEELIERCLKLFSFRNDIVLDPFNGVGTTTLVAARTGRRYIGYDISPDYCATAEKRIEDIGTPVSARENKREKGKHRVSVSKHDKNRRKRNMPQVQQTLEEGFFEHSPDD
ncbi:MAG: site-specific DNA-methyltransferase [Methanospirillum sp.]|nr:site-specific DNA-methyltransferase [Methanospirillum sp.]